MQKVHFVEAPNNFYLGAQVDPETHEIFSDSPVYYDARDLTTHGVILGMTGSGKTGLGIGILEEAALDGIPCLIIDPKGDITNMLLAFPDLQAEYFMPWINPDDAVRADQSVEELAQAIAQRWRDGLASWGIDNQRVQDYRRSARFSIYTPGSEAGLPISILQSLAAPQESWETNAEMLRERIAGIVTALLALIGINAKPVEDREHILLSNIFEYNWRNHTDLSMKQLILQVHHPPFSKLGVLDVDSVISEKQRASLAQMLNNIIAAPNFQSWIQGEPLNISSMLFTPEGYPRVTIFYTAHLTDAERQFITTLLLESIHSWMRTLSGSTSLRALVYIDEVVGMFPPHPFNPPTKGPIMRLLKQARAFGVGLLVSTQNPKDIDYKGLSNIGTWFIGKLQTENDKQRVLEGLDSARDATSALDIRTVDALISRLGPREFIMHNVHVPDTPILIHTRWTMSYLRGPLTRPQISQLMANQRGLYQGPGWHDMTSHQPAGQGVMPQQPAPSAPQGGWDVSPYPPPGTGMAGVRPGGSPTYSGGSVDTPSVPAPVPQPPRQQLGDEIPPGFLALPPKLPPSVHQFFLPTEYTVEQAIRNWEQWSYQVATRVETRKRLLYRPSLLAQARVRFADSKTNTFEVYTYAFVIPTPPRSPFVNWAEYVSEPFDPHALEVQPFSTAFYGELPESLRAASGFNALRDSLSDWIFQNAVLYAYYNPILRMYSSATEDRHSFMSRVQAAARERRDAEVDQAVERFGSRLAALEDRLAKREARANIRRDELEARKRDELLTAGESIMQLMRGRAYYTLSRTSRMRRYTATTQDQVGFIEREIEDIRAQIDATEEELEETARAIHEKWVNAARQLEEIRISPLKKDIDITVFGIGWVPYWDVNVNAMPLIIPASSSTLAHAQDQPV